MLEDEPITKEEFASWLINPVTKKVRYKIYQQIEEIKNFLAEGKTLDPNPALTAQMTVLNIGKVQGLAEFYFMQADEDEQTKNPSDRG